MGLIKLVTRAAAKVTAEVVGGAIEAVGEVTNSNFIKDVGKGIVHVSEKGVETVQAIREGDTDKAIEAGKELAKVAAVGVFSVGVIDIIDGADGITDGIGSDNVAQASALETADVEYTTEENPNTHHVTAHERVLPDGRTIWVDGDGDTSVDTQGGWEQHNPDYRIPKV
ncbi:hypothetical protein [Bacillus luti]|uniref:hypothetical protein n=1 Tax=Bacillus luti TaxID=2026191 RepID=UPI0012E9181E|nr:hypothetical protein [Bacillus luti]